MRISPSSRAWRHRRTTWRPDNLRLVVAHAQIAVTRKTAPTLIVKGARGALRQAFAACRKRHEQRDLESIHAAAYSTARDLPSCGAAGFALVFAAPQIRVANVRRGGPLAGRGRRSPARLSPGQHRLQPDLLLRRRHGAARQSRAAQPRAVRRLHDLEPLGGLDLIGTDHRADLVVEDFRRGARQ